LLTSYLNATSILLQNPGAPTSLYSTANLTTFINTARGQLAGEAECVRTIGTINTVVGQNAYPFSSINIGTPTATGIDGVFNIQTIQYVVASGQKWLNPRPWPWFQLYYLNNPVPQQGAPVGWSRFGQGASPGDTGPSQGGTFYLNPTPDSVYQLNCDCICYPILLADDTTPEAIPYPWTDCVPFFAAYWAYLSAQTGARQADAERMYNHYETFLERARKQTNSSVNRWQASQAEDPAQAAKFGIKAGGGA
jgi:hypothetical protein